MDLQVDHAVLAWSDRDALVAALSEVGLQPETGGTHGDGTTHMSLVGFDDGSYLEVISNVPGESPRRWPEQIEGDAGPAAWAILVQDVPATLKAGIDAGIAVRGPESGRRERPDGTRVEWDSGFYADTGAGLPFVIADRTPRRYRVTPTESVADGPLTGIVEVVVCVSDLGGAIGTYRRLYRFPTPIRTTAEGFGADLATFPGAPVTLATPAGGTSRLADRLAAYGPGPCAYLLGTDSMVEARDKYELTSAAEWYDRELRWFDAPALENRVGIVPDDGLP